MKSLKQITAATIATLFGFALMAFVMPQDQKKGGPWEIPEKYQKMENPYAGDKSLLKIGKMLYSKHCKSCHGSRGLGDGSKAAQLETFPGDFSSDEFKKYNDGELFYMSYVGRDEMPNYEKKIPDEEDQWAVIMFIKSL